MTNYINFQVEMTPENAEKIDMINKILIEGYAATGPATGGKTKVVAKEKVEISGEPTNGMTLEQVKQVAKTTKKKFGEEFAMEVLKDCGVDVKSSLGRSMSAIPKEVYSDVAALWEQGPSNDSDAPVEDDFDDAEEETQSIDPKEVEQELRAAAKVDRAAAKSAMNGNGVANIAGLKEATQDQLKAILETLKEDDI